MWRVGRDSLGLNEMPLRDGVYLGYVCYRIGSHNGVLYRVTLFWFYGLWCRLKQ